MARGMRRDRKKERFWRRHVHDQGRSGLSLRAYCEKRALSAGSFYWWKRELARRDGERRAGATEKRSRAVGSRVARRDGGRAREAVAFAEIEVAGGEGDPPEAETRSAGSDRAGVEVCLSGGRSIRVGRGFDEPTFLRVVALLEGGPPC